MRASERVEIQYIKHLHCQWLFTEPRITKNIWNHASSETSAMTSHDLALFEAQLGEPFIGILICYFSLARKRHLSPSHQHSIKKDNKYESAKTKRGRREGDDKNKSPQFATNVTTIYHIIVLSRHKKSSNILREFTTIYYRFLPSPFCRPLLDFVKLTCPNRH